MVFPLLTGQDISCIQLSSCSAALSHASNLSHEVRAYFASSSAKWEMLQGGGVSETFLGSGFVHQSKRVTVGYTAICSCPTKFGKLALRQSFTHLENKLWVLLQCSDFKLTRAASEAHISLSFMTKRENDQEVRTPVRSPLPFTLTLEGVSHPYLLYVKK